MRQAKLDIEKSDTSRAVYLDPQKVLSYVDEMRHFLDERGLFERKAFLRSFIEKISLGDGKVTLDYTFPPGLPKQETFSLRDILSSVPPKVIVCRTFSISSGFPPVLKLIDFKTRSRSWCGFRENILGFFGDRLNSRKFTYGKN